MRLWQDRIRPELSRAKIAAQRIRSRFWPPPAILMYHRIAVDSFDPWGLAVKPAHFRDQLSWLARNRTVLRLQEFAELHRRNALPSDAIALTIDDGYSCAADVASPLLEQFGVPATIFLPVELIEKGQPFWWDEVEEFVLNHDEESVILDEEAIPLGVKCASDMQWKPFAEPSTDRQRAFLNIHDRLRKKKPEDLEHAIEEIRSQARSKVFPEKRPLTPEQVRRTTSDLVEFGSHTLTHPSLITLDPDGRRHEICGSTDRLRAMTGRPAATFAYPFGTFDTRDEELAQQAGFECACACENAAISKKSRSFALPRLTVPDGGSADLSRVLTRAHTG